MPFWCHTLYNIVIPAGTGCRMLCCEETLLVDWQKNSAALLHIRICRDKRETPRENLLASGCCCFRTCAVLAGLAFQPQLDKPLNIIGERESAAGKLTQLTLENIWEICHDNNKIRELQRATKISKKAIVCFPIFSDEHHKSNNTLISAIITVLIFNCGDYRIKKLLQKTNKRARKKILQIGPKPSSPYHVTNPEQIGHLSKPSTPTTSPRKVTTNNASRIYLA